ncbi:chemotaxis protein CheA [Pectinatus brassicae]|uniref:Chemotaxis protein CheA n=1 Tax=Pectinatus brassicae TaxID=862415 RepID=A0A840UHG1_9FIRM|nr:chemotaxis protein CheA [Pectinatus brassicae]MBB5336556.1 two-component system chemotaxis sensor kinase CheA [Pectinatus brassicae]
MDNNQYMEMFLEESRDHLQSLNERLLDLEQDPTDSDAINEIFRSAHTLKGMSATMGYSKIAELTHDMENVLDLIRNDKLVANEDIVDVLFKSIDALQQMVDNVSNGEAEDLVEVKDLVDRLNQIASGSTEASPAKAAPVVNKQPAAPITEKSTEKSNSQQDIVLTDIDIDLIQKAKQSGLRALHINVELIETCVLKAVRSYMVMSALDEVGDVIKTIPSTEDLEQEKFEYSFDIVLITGEEEQQVKNILMEISEIQNVTVQVLEVEAPVKAPVKAAAPAVVKDDKKPAAPDKKKQAIQHHDNMKSGQSVRVGIEKLDSLMNLVGELVINKTRLEQIGNTHRIAELVETVEQMDRVTGDLQSIVMKVRMVPVGQVFNRFPRVVRDLAKELNKEVNLTIEGEDTELDRTVIDEIGDPLVHLIRNSMDHGVEHPDDREAKGKSRVGQVGLIARHEGNNVIIMVTDDGAGINAAKVRSKAVEKGVVTQEDADNMTDAEAVRLVFLPGFSTSDVITDVSGRGVGMDVVRTTIEALGGVIDVETKENEGSIFKIKLPLTLAIIQALLVNVQEEIYAIPLAAIDSTINITPEDIKTIQNKETIVIRGEIIPIVRLDKALNLEATEDAEELYVVIVHVGDKKCGIMVDKLIGQQEIVIKTLGKLLSGIKVISGATVLGNGQIALILDVAILMQ